MRIQLIRIGVWQRNVITMEVAQHYSGRILQRSADFPPDLLVNGYQRRMGKPSTPPVT